MQGGGQSAQAPTVDPAQTGRQIGIYNQNIGRTSRATGDANRAEITQQSLFGLSMLDDSGNLLNAEELKKLRGQQTKEEASLAKLQASLGKAKSPKEAAALQKRIDALAPKVTERAAKITQLSDPNFAANRIRSTFAEQYAMRDDMAGRMRGAQNPSAEYSRMQQALGRGIQAQETDAGMLGDQLMRRASDMVAQGGQLSPEAARDAVQAARSGMAARGLATGNAGLAAEFLNRDRFARQREFENLGFARGVQTEDLARRQNNAMQRDATNRFNLGLIEQSSLRANEEQARQLGLGSDLYNFMMSTDPKLMAAGIGSPYASLTGTTQASQHVVGGIAMNPQYSGAQFSSSNNMAGNMLAGGLGGAAAMLPTGNPYLIAGGGAVGLLGGARQQ